MVSPTECDSELIADLDQALAVAQSGGDEHRRDSDHTPSSPLGDRFDVVLLRFGRMRRKRGRFLGRFTWLVGLDLGHLFSNAALSFQSVIGVLQPQEIAFGQIEKLA